MTRALLAGGFCPADVAGAVGRHVGPCSPMRLRAILSGGHVERAPRPEPELARGPVRDLVVALVATLPAVDADSRPRPRIRDREREERDEALSWGGGAGTAVGGVVDRRKVAAARYTVGSGEGGVQQDIRYA